MSDQVKREPASLVALRDKVAALKGPDREVDAEIGIALGLIQSYRWRTNPINGRRDPVGLHPSTIGVEWLEHLEVPSLTASIDASVALVAKVMPPTRAKMILEWRAHHMPDVCSASFYDESEQFGATVPLAILLALLEAKIAALEASSESIR